MKKISTAELKKAILAVEAERAKHPARFRPDRAQRATLNKRRQASDKMASGFLKEAGLDLKKFQALQEQRSVELERMVAQHKTDALRLAKQRKDTLHSSIAAQSKALADLGARSDFFPYPTFTLDTPFLIWTIPLTDIADSAAVPFGSWAKFDFKTSQTLDQKVGFYFYWANPYGDYAVINAATFMSASGHLRAHAPWGLGVNTSSVEADALFNLWFGWPTGVTSSNYDAAYIGSIGAYSQTFIGPDVEATSVSSGVSLSTTMFAVPPNDVVVFEVALSLYCDNDSGNTDADFASGDFQIACPTGSDQLMSLSQVCAELSRRLARIFLPGPDGRRPVDGGAEIFWRDPHWRGLIPFHEYFHGDTGAGIGASHQTGWTGLVAKLLQQEGD